DIDGGFRVQGGKPDRAVVRSGVGRRGAAGCRCVSGIAGLDDFWTAVTSERGGGTGAGRSGRADGGGIAPSARATGLVPCFASKQHVSRGRGDWNGGPDQAARPVVERFRYDA